MRRRMGIIVLLLLAGAIGATVVPAAAKPKKVRAFTAVLTAGQEPENPASTGLGVAMLTFDEASSLLSYSITFQGLAGVETGAHFHGPAAPGVNAGILFPIAQTGGSKVGSVGPLSKEQAADLKKGLLYINIHTDTATAGEIRGQVLPNAASYPVGD